MSNLLGAFLTLLIAGLVWSHGTASAHPGHQHDYTPPWQVATPWPDRVIVTFADDPATTLTLNWRTDASVGWTVAQIAAASPDARFDLAYDVKSANTEIIDLELMETDRGPSYSRFNIGLGKVAYHSVTFKNLEPDTLYAWRVRGAEGLWSEWYQTRTAPLSGPIKFVFFGDAQLGIRSHWSRVIRMAQTIAPDANFFVHGGDLVDRADRDKEWAAWFEAGGFIFAQIPQVPVAGNHDTLRMFTDDPKGNLRRSTPKGENRVSVRSPLWPAQFELPVDPELPLQLQERQYVIEYTDDLHLFVVDSNTVDRSVEPQREWLDRALRASNARWKVVTMHHPFFVPTSMNRRADKARVDAFMPLMEKYNVDLVLVGHFHAYLRASEQPDRQRYVARESVPSGGETALGAINTMYAISVSGGAAGDFGESGEDPHWFDLFGVEDLAGDGVVDFEDLSVDRVAANTPMFQVVEVDGDVLSYKAYMANGIVYDAVTLLKNADGTKTLVDGTEAFGRTRLMGNTGPVKRHHDIRD